MSVESFYFTKLVVADIDAAEAFYRDALGLRTLIRTMAPGGEWGQEQCVMAVAGRQDGAMLMLIRLLEKPAPPPGEVWTGFAVTNLNETSAAVELAGGRVLVTPHEVPGLGILAGVFADPEGHMIELVERIRD